MRRLLTTRRHVALDRADEYVQAWGAARRAVQAVGGNAWLFRGAEHDDHFREFIEWQDGAPAPADDDAVRLALSVLDAFAQPGPLEEWEELS